MKSTLTAEDIAEYKKNGVIKLSQVISQEMVEQLRQAMQAQIEKYKNTPEYYLQYGRVNKEGLIIDEHLWQKNETFKRYILDSNLAAYAAKLLNSKKIQLFTDSFIYKDINNQQPVSWHHDLPYYPLDGSQSCRIWLALDHVNKNNGAIEYVLGSHLWGKKFRPASVGNDSHNNLYTKANLSEIPDFDQTRDDYEMKLFDLEPGDALLFDSLCVHGSAVNHSNHLRRGVTSWLIGDDIRYQPKPWNLDIRKDMITIPGNKFPEEACPVL